MTKIMQSPVEEQRPECRWASVLGVLGFLGFLGYLERTGSYTS